MIGGCVTSGKYNMTGVVYEKSTVQNSNTGQVKAQYLNGVEVQMVARGLANLRGKDSGTLQDWGNKLDDYHYLRVKTMYPIEEGWVVAGIKDANGLPYGDEQFIVLGVTPTFDPFGSFMEYDIICNKSEVHIKLPDALVTSGDSTSLAGSDA
jgi:hypothetical protein